MQMETEIERWNHICPVTRPSILSPHTLPNVRQKRAGLMPAGLYSPPKPGRRKIYRQTDR